MKQREDELVQGRIEGQKIIQDAVERAKLEKKRILEQAEVEVQGLKTKARIVSCAAQMVFGRRPECSAGRNRMSVHPPFSRFWRIPA